METLPEEITTERLTLRRWEVSDGLALHQAVNASIEHLRPWMEWIKFEPLTVAARQDLIRSWRVPEGEAVDAIYGVFHEGQVVGGCGFHRRIGPGALEIGYWIHADHVRRGFATELSKGLTETGLAIPGIERIEIHHDKDNVASGGIPRALGYTLVGEIESEIKAPAETGVTLVWQLSELASD